MTKRIIRGVVTIALLALSGFLRPTFAQASLASTSADVCNSPKIGDAESILNRKCPPSALDATISIENSSITPTGKPKTEGPTPIPEPQVTWTAPQSSSTSGSNLNPDVIFNLINQFRATINLPPFQKDATVCSIAQARIPELPAEAANGDYHHGLYAMNLPYWITENMKFGSDEAGTVNWWLHSPIHHKAIVSDNKYSCGACNGNICVEEFTSYIPK